MQLTDSFVSLMVVSLDGTLPVFFARLRREPNDDVQDDLTQDRDEKKCELVLRWLIIASGYGDGCWGNAHHIKRNTRDVEIDG